MHLHDAAPSSLMARSIARATDRVFAVFALSEPAIFQG